MLKDDQRLRILISIGGGPEAFACLRFAHRLGETACAEISLLYVRPLDSGLQSGGMEVRVARENVLDWGIELPGLAHLKKARDILAELGEMEQISDGWQHRKISGDSAGEFVREYLTPCGGSISLRLRTAPDVTTAVVDEAKRFNADFLIVGGSPEPLAGWRKLISRKPLALKIAAHSPCSVIVARNLNPEYGHLVCVNDSELSRAMLPEAARLGRACGCSVTLLSVAATEEERETSLKVVDEAAEVVREGGIEPKKLVKVGDPAEIITETGYGYSLIVMAESEKPWFAKSLSIAHTVADQARNSVLIIK